MSRIGLSTYAFFWRMSPQVPQPLTLAQMLQHTADLDVSVFQICDYPAIEQWSDDQLLALRQQADALGITLELGTRGLGSAHLRRYLHIAAILDARVVRSMFNTADHRPSLDEAANLIAAVLPDFARQQVRLCLETYEQVSSAAMMSVINRFLAVAVRLSRSGQLRRRTGTAGAGDRQYRCARRQSAHQRFRLYPPCRLGRFYPGRLSDGRREAGL